MQIIIVCILFFRGMDEVVKTEMRLRWAALPLVLLTVVYPSADPGSEVDGLVSQWIGLEQQRSRLQSDWLVRSQHLKQQLELLKLEERTLRQFLDAHRGTRDEVEAKRFQLLEQQTALEARQEGLTTWLDAVVALLERLQPRLPPPLAAEWQESLEISRAGNGIGNSERLNHLVSMLKTTDEFQRRIPIRTTTMTVADGVTMRVDQAFLGLSQGWYVTADGQHAGYGRPGAGDWRWIDRNQVDGLDTDTVRRLIDMVRVPATASLLELPVQLGTPQ